MKFSLLGAGWVLWLLVILSIISVSIMVERTIVYVRLASRFGELSEKLRAFLRANDTSGAIEYLDAAKGAEAAVAAAGLREADRGHATAEETMVGVRKRMRLVLEQNLAFLGTVGNNAPFIGLFGTVLGIIKAFHSLSGAESANFKVVMADISEALVATGVGLLVAIPAVVAFNIFSRRVRGILTNCEAVEHLVLAQLKGEPLGGDSGGGGEDKKDETD
ncbi:MAG: MotA/TolQ/ExbB proton channel family protein [bacterium]